MQWPVAIAFAKRDAALREEIDAVLDRIGGKIEELKAKYGFPTQIPVKLSQSAAAASPVQLVAFTGELASDRRAGSQARTAAATPGQKFAEETPPEPAADSLVLVADGKEFFNGTCAHCHGPNAEQSERKIDLRLLHHRYGDGMEEMFFKTVTAGRPAKGMPSWKDVFTAEQFTAIYAFLKTVQTN